MKTGIIGAMDQEVAILAEAIENPQTTSVAGMTFTEGKIGSADTVVVRCGIGKICAAVCAQILIDRFHVTHLINTGIAGSLNADIDIGDAVVATEAVHHDLDVTNFGYDFGQVPGFRTQAFPADEALRSLCIQAIRSEAPDIHVFEGRIASGDQFIRTKERKEWIREHFGAECCEMEGAAIAQTAYMNQIPYVIIRMISDKADESAVMAYPEFEAQAARNSAALLLKVLHTIRED